MLSQEGFKNLHCLDISEAMLKVARQGDYPIRIYNEDASKTHFKDGVFDIVIISFAIHEKEREIQERIIKEGYRILKEDGFILVVDYVFDDHTTGPIKAGIRIIERIAGKKHYLNFKNYIRNNGLSGLIKDSKFALIQERRAMFNGVTISTYKKSVA